MSWNYRVMKHTEYPVNVAAGMPEEWFAIHEVHYEEETGDPKSWSVDPMHPQGSTLDELKADIKLMTDALNKPVMEFGDDG